MFMVWAGVTSSEVKRSFPFVEDSVKNNHHVYLNMLNDKIVPWMNALTINNVLLLQKDGATAHTAFWLKEMWPTSSPGLNLMDFGLCSIIEQKPSILSQPNVVVLIKNSTDSRHQNESETVRAQGIQHLRRVILEKGRCRE